MPHQQSCSKICWEVAWFLANILRRHFSSMVRQKRNLAEFTWGSSIAKGFWRHFLRCRVVNLIWKVFRRPFHSPFFVSFLAATAFLLIVVSLTNVSCLLFSFRCHSIGGRKNVASQLFLLKLWHLRYNRRQTHKCRHIWILKQSCV